MCTNSEAQTNEQSTYLNVDGFSSEWLIAIIINLTTYLTRYLGKLLSTLSGMSRKLWVHLTMLLQKKS